MENEHGDDESPKDFLFPMSKQEKQKRLYLEDNIRSIIDDEDDFVIKINVRKDTVSPIKLQNANSDKMIESTITAKDKYIYSSSLTGTTNQTYITQGELEGISETKDAQVIKPQTGNKKLSLLSSGYTPKPKVFKKGKLK